MAINQIYYAISAVITLIIILLAYYKLWFLRKPERSIPPGRSTVVSPANGRISRIIRTGSSDVKLRKGLIGRIRTMTRDTAKNSWLITIVMNPFNVHYQRAPSECRIISRTYRKGKLLNAVSGAGNMKATLENEKNEILMSTALGRMKVIQVAGMFARRIECFAGKNQNIKKGGIIGLIRFGSQVCLVIPRTSGFKILAEEGQYVVDGETVIAEKKGK